MIKTRKVYIKGAAWDKISINMVCVHKYMYGIAIEYPPTHGEYTDNNT